jgi:hypothetical protein
MEPPKKLLEDSHWADGLDPVGEFLVPKATLVVRHLGWGVLGMLGF